jgi:hypothetical protein
MANCSFISATEARNLARNNTLLWTEICEVQTQILTAIDSNLYSVLVNDGTPMTSTQSITSVAVTSGGSGYSVLSATAVINDNGTGGSAATVTPDVTAGSTTITGFTVTNGGSGYTPVSATASVQVAYNLNDAQDETDYVGGANGTFIAGVGYAVGDVITLADNSTVTVAAGGVTDAGQRVLIAAQDETNFNGVAANGGFSSGGGHVIGDVITLADGATITVDNVAAGVVTEFTVTTISTNSTVSTTLRIQTATTGSGTGFTLTSGTANETVVGAITLFDVASAGADPIFLGSNVIQASVTGTGIGTGFALAPTTLNATVIAHAGGVAALTPIVTNGAITSVAINAPGTSYVVSQPILFSHPSGTGATASVASVNGTGGITAITVTASGSGYEQAVATVTVTAPGGLTPAVEFVGTVTTSGGVVTGIIITEGGVGYADLYPTLTVSDPTGTGATFTTNVAGGLLTAVNVVTGGAGYSQTPTPTILNSDGVTVNNTAVLVFTVGANTFGTDPSDYNDVLIGQSSDAVITDQIQYVLDYFTALGYNIRAQTNSATGDSIQWQITW